MKNTFDMKKTFKNLLLIIAFSFLAYSCGDDDGGTNPPVQPTKGDISGEVNLYDEGPTETDKSGMKISASGKSATTDVEGNFTIKDVPFGKQEIVYEKSDYGTFKFFGLDHQHEKSHLVNTFSLGKESKTVIISLTTKTSGADVEIEATTSGTNTSRRYLRFFYGTERSVSKTDYTHYTQIRVSLAEHTDPFIHKVSQRELNDLGFASGATVYVKAYGESFWGNDYEDSSVNYRIFPNLNATSADAVSFVVP